MSSPEALATVTATLRHILLSTASQVTTKPPSLARGDETGSQLNIFLYSTQINPAFSNFPLPGAARSGENSPPPLALALNYLITAYGANDDDISGQQVMGRAMSILHDHPLLSQADIAGIVPDSGLQNQIERVRITPEPISLDDMFKLWSSFQSAEYRLSTVYQISAVLIDSTLASRAALPVLRRGEQDRGATVSAAPLPALTGIRFPLQKPAAEFGDRIVLLGERLTADNVSVRFEHPLLVDPLDPTKKLPIELTPAADGNDAELPVVLPSPASDPAVGSKWPAGFYQVSLVVARPNTPDLTSSIVAMALAPQILSVNPANAPAGDVVLMLTCRPQLRAGQRVALLFGDQLVTPDNVVTPPNPTQPTTLTFTVTAAKARPAPYVLRLRVDGADSIPVDFSGPVPQFAANQTVTIT